MPYTPEEAYRRCFISTGRMDLHLSPTPGGCQGTDTRNAVLGAALDFGERNAFQHWILVRETLFFIVCNRASHTRAGARDRVLSPVRSEVANPAAGRGRG